MESLGYRAWRTSENVHHRRTVQQKIVGIDRGAIATEAGSARTRARSCVHLLCHARLQQAEINKVPAIQGQVHDLVFVHQAAKRARRDFDKRRVGNYFDLLGCRADLQCEIHNSFLCDFQFHASLDDGIEARQFHGYVVTTHC